MTSSKKSLILIISFLGPLIVGGSVAYWLYATPSSTSEPATATIPAAPLRNSDPVEEPIIIPITTSASETEIGVYDQSSEYARLFESLGAKKLEFKKIGTGEIYAYYATDVANSKKLYPDAAPYEFRVSMIDLNNDKSMEAVVYLDLPGYCGSGGCTIEVLRKQGKTWNRIFSGLGYETIGVTESIGNGYANLIISVHGEDVAYMTKVIEYIFNERAYERWDIVSIWNGRTFSPVE